MNAIQTYAVFTCNDEDAETELSAHDVVRHIYRHDGGDYRLEPAMLRDRCDEDNNELPDIQETTSNGDLVFEIWFKYSGSLWDTDQCIAIGKDEAEAEAQFLQESFEDAAWDNSHWTVLRTDQYLAELEQEQEQEQD